MTLIELTLVNFLLLATLYIIGICLTAWIFSLFLRSGTQTKHAKMQTELMVKMAQRAGITPDEIEGVRNAAFPPVWY